MVIPKMEFHRNIFYAYACEMAKHTQKIESIREILSHTGIRIGISFGGTLPSRYGHTVWERLFFLQIRDLETADRLRKKICKSCRKGAPCGMSYR